MPKVCFPNEFQKKRCFFPLVFQNPPLATFVSRWCSWEPPTHQSQEVLGLLRLLFSRCERIPKTQPPPKEVILENPETFNDAPNNYEGQPPPPKKTYPPKKCDFLWVQQKPSNFNSLNFDNHPENIADGPTFNYIDSAPTSPLILQVAAAVSCCNSRPATPFKSNRPCFRAVSPWLLPEQFVKCIVDLRVFQPCGTSTPNVITRVERLH